MHLETERLILRKFSHDDWEDLYEYLSDKNVVKYEPYGAFTQDECKREVERRSGDNAFWAVCLRESGKLIGNVYFQQVSPQEFRTWEIGYVFNPGYHGKGYATEACLRIMDYAFTELNAHRIIGMCNPDNTPSWKLMERLNMRREGHFLKAAFFKRNLDGNPVWHDSLQYSILNEEWLELNRDVRQQTQ